MSKRLTIVIMVICLAAIIVMLPFASACSSGPKTGQELKIGVMTPSTGVAAEKGAPGGHGFIDAIEYINKELGGAGGYPIKLSWRDSAYDMAKVATIVKDFMNEGDLMFATHASAEMKAAQEIANRAEFPGIATFSSQINYRPPQHIYGPTPNYGDDWVAFTNYFMKNVWKGTAKPKMALHLLNNPTGAGAREAARAFADKMGVQIVADEEHAATTIDETNSLTRIKGKSPDVIYVSSTPAPTAIILKNAKQLGLNIPIGSGAAGFTKALIDLAGADVAEGVYGVYHTVSWDDNAPGIAKAAEYVKKNNAKDYGNMDYLSTWTTALIMREALALAVKSAGYDVLAKGNVDSWRAVEKQGIQKLNGYSVEGLQGPVTYVAGDNRLGKAVKLYRITGGKINQIQDWTDSPLVKYEEFDWWGK